MPEAKKPQPDTQAELTADIGRASDFTMTSARFLWYPYLPLGKITILDGDPGRGKSMITCDLAARVITGSQMPGGIIFISTKHKEHKPRGVVMICAEDDWSDTILPRLVAAIKSLCPKIDADVGLHECLRRVAVILLPKDDDGKVIPLEFPRDVAVVKQAIAEVDAVFVAVDPIMAFLGSKTNTGADASVRRALSPFKDLAAETGAAFVLVRHLNKSTDLKAEYRGGGSHGGFAGLARSMWMVNNHPDEPNQLVFCHSKSNLSARGGSLTYSIDGREVCSEEGEVIATAGIAWGEDIDMDVDTLMRGHDSRKDAPAREACWDDMRMLLDEQDPRPSVEMAILLKGAGHTADTIKRTKSHYNVHSVRHKDDAGKTTGWDWTRQPPLALVGGGGEA